MMMGTAESSAFNSDYWECILAQRHGCHGDATDLPRLFLTVGGKKLPCQQLCGILAAGENAEMMCSSSIWELKKTSLNAVGNSAPARRKKGFDEDVVLRRFNMSPVRHLRISI